MKGRVFLRFIALPAFRVGEQLGESGARIRRMSEEAAAARARTRGSLDAIDAKGMTSAQRFEAMYEANGWTPEQLADQLATVRLTKLVAICSAIVGLVLGFITMWYLPVWTLWIAGPGIVGLCSLGAARTLQFGLYQAQIEERRVLRLSEYLARKDLFAHLFGR